MLYHRDKDIFSNSEATIYPTWPIDNQKVAVPRDFEVSHKVSPIDSLSEGVSVLTHGLDRGDEGVSLRYLGQRPLVLDSTHL